MLDAVSTARATERGVFLCVWGREREQACVEERESKHVCEGERERQELRRSAGNVSEAQTSLKETQQRIYLFI